MPPPKNTPEKFWAKVKTNDPNGCWEIPRTRTILSNGKPNYGSAKLNNRNWRPARLAWTLTYGPIPEGLFVCHSCDNPPCCNPSHLFLGTNNDNRQDCIRKGRDRYSRGEDNPQAKLTREKVEEARRLFATGNYTYIDLARRFGMGKGPMTRAIKGISWKP